MGEISGETLILDFHQVAIFLKHFLRHGNKSFKVVHGTVTLVK